MTATAADDLAARHELDAAVIFTHPLRVRLVELIAERGRTSPRKLADELSEQLGTVSYHVRVLVKLGLLREDGYEPQRGALEHFYRVDPQAVEALDRLTFRAAALRGRIDRNGAGP